MINQISKTACFLFTIILAGCLSAYGQSERVGRTQQPITSAGRFVITNGNTTTRVNFYLKGKNGSWHQFALDPAQDGEYWNATAIKILSEGGKTVEYRVEAEKRYKIYWNEAGKYWDVQMLR